MIWLPEKDIGIKTHQRAIERYGGLPGLKSLGALESACEAPHRSAFGAFVFATVEEKACALTFELLTQHAFNDGNKRVGLRALLMTLRMNGGFLLASQDDLFEVIIAVADSASMRRQDLIFWVTE